VKKSLFSGDDEDEYGAEKQEEPVEEEETKIEEHAQ
jgi:hypothetical protein